MIFYRVNWQEDDSPDGTAEEVFDSLREAKAFARKKAIESAETVGDGAIFSLYRSKVPSPITRKVVKELLSGYHFGDSDNGGHLEDFVYERRCRRCKHTTTHEDGEDEDACAYCFADRIEEKDICRDPDWVVRRVERAVKP